MADKSGSETTQVRLLAAFASEGEQDLVALSHSRAASRRCLAESRKSAERYWPCLARARFARIGGIDD
jgi:hypothetical protein